MSHEIISVVERPAESLLHKREGFARVLHETWASGKAVRVPLNGETYAVIRNRKAAYAYRIAVALKARVCTAKDTDGSLLIWLEPKPEAK